MKVLLVNQYYPPDTLGGAGVSVGLLARGLRQAGVEVVVACQGARDQVREWEGVRVHEIVPRNMHRERHVQESFLRRLVWHARDVRNAPMGRRVAAVIDEERPDLVHTNVIAGFSVAVWDRVRTLGTPLVHTIRDYYLLCPRATMFKDQNCESQCRVCRILSEPKRRSADAVHHVVGISEFVLERHRSLGWFEHTPSSVIHNPVEVPEDPPRPKRKARLRLGYLGRLHPSKGVGQLVRAFKRARLGDAVLRIAGTGEESYIEELKDAAEGSAIEFLGHVPPSELLDSCDALVVPSVWDEPLGRVVLEAFAHGVPVVAARRGGIPEIVEEGHTGWLFDPDKPAEWVSQMETAAYALRQPNSIREECLEAAEQTTVDGIAERYAGLYRALVEGV